MVRYPAGGVGYRYSSFCKAVGRKAGIGVERDRLRAAVGVVYVSVADYRQEGLESISAIQATFIRMLSGTLGMLLFGTATRRLGRWAMPFKDPNLACLFLASVCVVTFGVWLSLVAIKYVDVSIANTLNSTEPLFILPLTAIFLKEKIAFRAVVGTFITTVGIVFLCAS